MFYQFSFSPQAKQSVIINNKRGIYKLSHKLPNDLRLIREYQENLSISHNYSLVPSLSSKIKLLLILAPNPLKMEIELFPLCIIFK